MDKSFNLEVCVPTAKAGKERAKTMIIKKGIINADEIVNRNLKGYYVYLHKHDNIVFYVGKGTGSRCIKSNDRSLHWKNIVNKYGYEIEIVKDDLTNDEANILEIELITKYGRTDLNKGTLCNLTDGGDGVVNRIFSKEEKIAISNRIKGEGNPMFNKCFYGKDNPNFGNKGSKNPLSKAVVALTLKGEFLKEYESIADTATDKYTPSNVSIVISGKRKQHMNTLFMFKVDYDPNKNYTYTRGATTKRKVVQIDKTNNKILALYESASETKISNFNPKNVQQVCAGDKNTHKGFIWKYFDELDEVLQNAINKDIV